MASPSRFDVAMFGGPAANDAHGSFPERYSSSPGVLRSGGDGGDNGAMEARVQILEQGMTDVRERLARIETRLEQMPTKGEMYQAINAQTWRVIGASAALVAAVYFIARYLPPAT